MKKVIAFYILALFALSSKGQIIIKYPGSTNIPIVYDTIKVIAEIYVLPNKIATPRSVEWEGENATIIYDSVYSWDSVEVRIKNVLAWEIRQEDPWSSNNFNSYKIVKRLTFNRKDELKQVRQTWKID